MDNTGKVRKINGWKYATVILTAILAALILLTWSMLVRWRMEAHNALREARNAWMALRMTSVEYYGLGTSMYDAGRRSGLVEAAEKQVREIAEFTGDVSVLKNDKITQVPTEMLYHEGAYMVYYYLGNDSSRNWEVYRTHDLFGLSTATLRESEE